MIYTSLLSIYLIATLVDDIMMQKYEGDICELNLFGTFGTCVQLDACESAQRNYQQNGVMPEFCTYDAFGTSLVCCEKGQSLVRTSESPQANLLRSDVIGNQEATPRREEEDGDIMLQKYEGDICELNIIGTFGTCVQLDACESAKRNYAQTGIMPKFCTYSTFGTSLVCCEKDQSSVRASDRPQPNVLHSGVTRNQGATPRREEEDGDIMLQKYEGDVCELNLIGTFGTCVQLDACESAKRNYAESGTMPKFCTYSTFGTSLVCCEDQSLVRTTDSPQANLLRSDVTRNQEATSSKEDDGDIMVQKYEGDICELNLIGTFGTCVQLDACESAKRSYAQNGIMPKFCTYNAFGTSLVCCEKGQSLVRTSENPRPNLLRSEESENQKATPKKGEEDSSCVEDYTGTLGICTPLDQCQSAKLNQEKNGIQPTFCKYNVFGESLVCCKDGKTILQTLRPKTADPKPLFAVENDGRRVSERKCDAYSGQVTEKVVVSSLLINDDGISVAATKCQYTGIELIIGGEDARQGEFPHMAAIGWANYEGGYNFNCGGSLISTKFILTAGHCRSDPRAYSPEPVVARLGDQNIDSKINDGADPIDVPIRHVYTHPEYKPPLKYNDIALLELASDVQFEDAIRPACLWTKPDFGENNYGVATGWGVKSVLTKETSKELQKVSLTLLNNDFCGPLLEHTYNRHWRGFRNGQMCAGELRGGKDTCQGDSGSPLQVTSKENRCIYYIMGLTSFGKSCGEKGLPAIYTQVSSYLDWIEKIVWPDE